MGSRAVHATFPELATHRIVMKHPLAALAIALALPWTAHADLAFNASAVSDYRYRGISQTRLRPALQAGVDYSHDSGFYAGAWASTLRWVRDGGGDGRVELDLYTGLKGTWGDGWGYDLGVLRYQYPRNHLPVNANTTELYAALSQGPFMLKYSRSTTPLFGTAGSRGSGYLDAGASLEWEGITIAPHIGRQIVARNGALSYTDYSLTLSKTVQGVVLSAAWVGTSTRTYRGPEQQNLGKSGLVIGARLNF